jgi:hypothetical protein
MRSVDADTVATIDRYRAAYDRADGAEEEEPESYGAVATWLLGEFLRLARIAWAVANPLEPLSPEILIEASEVGTEDLHEVLPELRRFGEAILTQGDPSRLAELVGLGHRERQQRELFEAAMRRAASQDAVGEARQVASAFEQLLRLLDAEQRRTILTEFENSLACE